MVTRTIPTTTLQVMCVDTRTKEVITVPVVLPGKSFPADVKDERLEKELLKKADSLTNKSIKPVKITKITVTKELFGLTEEQFLKYSVQLDPETRKPLNNQKED